MREKTEKEEEGGRGAGTAWLERSATRQLRGAARLPVSETSGRRVGASRAARGEEVGTGRYGWMDGSMECTGCARGSRRIGRGDPEVGGDPVAAVEGQTS